MLEIIQFLVWLTRAKGQRESKWFQTTSSDVFTFTIILQEIGLDILETVKETKRDFNPIKSRLKVKFNSSTIIISNKES